MPPRKLTHTPTFFAAAAIAAAFVVTSSAHTASPDVAAGASFDVISYRLALTPAIADKSVAGRETITFRPTVDGLREIDFTGNALMIDNATLDGAPVSVKATHDVLGFASAQPLSRGRTATLVITYHGKPARGVAGAATSLYTSYFACDWMVCAQNAFGDKADFLLDLRVPAGTDTLSVGRRTATRAGPDGSEIHRWKASRTYSAYLYGFAVGRFARAEQRIGSARLSYLSDVADPTELRRRFAKTPEMVRFLSSKAGVPLPVADYSQLLVAGNEAQEAATYSVLGVDELPTKPDEPAEDWAIVHELTHEWWGNLVTCATLRDFWLNEGITTFMTAAWKEHRYGRAAYEAELDEARERLARARAKGFDKPLAWDGAYPSLGVRRAIQYSKGALFMDHLRTVLGDDAFWTGLKRYTRAHAGGTVTSSDLEHAMERASNRDLGPVFDEWVYGQKRSAAGTAS